MKARSLAPSTPPTGARRLALWIVVAHVGLAAAFGQHYAKLDLGLYPTDIALIAATLLGLGAVFAVPRDAITRNIGWFVAIGCLWALMGGLGSSGVGPKAFSFFVYSAFYFVVRGTATTDRERWHVLQVIALASVVGAGLGLWQMRTGTPMFDSERLDAFGFEETSTGSTRLLPGEFGLYALFALVIAVAMMSRDRRIRPATGVLFACAAIELVLAQHRSGLVALAGALGATGLFLVGSRRLLRAGVRIAIYVVVGSVLFSFVFDSSYIDDTIVRMQHIGDTADVNTAWRLLSWLEVSAGIADNPLGHGFAHWDFAFTMLKPLSGSHNSYLDLAYRVGVPGLLVFLALPVRLIGRTRRLVQRAPSGQALPIAVCTCVLAYLIYAFFNVVLETPYMSIFFWVLLGIGAGAVADRIGAAGARGLPGQAVVAPEPPAQPAENVVERRDGISQPEPQASQVVVGQGPGAPERHEEPSIGSQDGAHDRSR